MIQCQNMSSFVLTKCKIMFVVYFVSGIVFSIFLNAILQQIAFDNYIFICYNQTTIRDMYYWAFMLFLFIYVSSRLRYVKRLLT